jgi:hypothetical protein
MGSSPWTPNPSLDVWCGMGRYFIHNRAIPSYMGSHYVVFIYLLTPSIATHSNVYSRINSSLQLIFL